MAFDRYSNVDLYSFGQGQCTSNAHLLIRNAVADNAVSFTTIVLQGAQRLDTLAGQYYNDGRYWWVIAAASQIGWAPQVPPGTVLKIPNLSEVAKLFTQ